MYQAWKTMAFLIPRTLPRTLSSARRLEYWATVKGDVGRKPLRMPKCGDPFFSLGDYFSVRHVGSFGLPSSAGNLAVSLKSAPELDAKNWSLLLFDPAMAGAPLVSIRAFHSKTDVEKFAKSVLSALRANSKTGAENLKNFPADVLAILGSQICYNQCSIFFKKINVLLLLLLVVVVVVVVSGSSTSRSRSCFCFFNAY